jgi:hypothetical protein
MPNTAVHATIPGLHTMGTVTLPACAWFIRSKHVGLLKRSSRLLRATCHTLPRSVQIRVLTPSKSKTLWHMRSVQDVCVCVGGQAYPARVATARACCVKSTSGIILGATINFNLQHELFNQLRETLPAHSGGGFADY